MIKINTYTLSNKKMHYVRIKMFGTAHFPPPLYLISLLVSLLAMLGPCRYIEQLKK